MKTKEMLASENLILRPLGPDDIDRVHSWASVPANVRYMDWGPNSREESLAFIKGAKPGYEFGIVLKRDEILIGSCGIYPQGEKTAEVGWTLHRDYWRQGYGREVAQVLLEYGFETIKLHRIFAVCAADNEASYKLMESVGMRREAVNVKARWGRVDKKWLDQYLYAILADEYEALNY